MDEAPMLYVGEKLELIMDKNLFRDPLKVPIANNEPNAFLWSLLQIKHYFQHLILYGKNCYRTTTKNLLDLDMNRTKYIIIIWIKKKKISGKKNLC